MGTVPAANLKHFVLLDLREIMNRLYIGEVTSRRNCPLFFRSPVFVSQKIGDSNRHNEKISDNFFVLACAGYRPQFLLSSYHYRGVSVIPHFRTPFIELVHP